jgi:hypothetical protein
MGTCAAQRTKLLQLNLPSRSERGKSKSSHRACISAERTLAESLEGLVLAVHLELGPEDLKLVEAVHGGKIGHSETDAADFDTTTTMEKVERCARLAPAMATASGTRDGEAYSTQTLGCNKKSGEAGSGGQSARKRVLHHVFDGSARGPCEAPTSWQCRDPQSAAHNQPHAPPLPPPCRAGMPRRSAP